MTPREPPPLATFLLKRFVTGARSESLLGDLLEEYQTGRTAGWYWRETLAALLVFVRREACELPSRAAMQILVVLIAPAALLVGLIMLSAQYRQRCPTPLALLSGSITLITYAGVAGIAISLLLWLASLHHPLRAARRRGLVRLSVVAFAAVGFSGGALTWASTTSCSPAALACPASSVMLACTPRGRANPDGRLPLGAAARSDAPSRLH